jgi:hypothetical protein
VLHGVHGALVAALHKGATRQQYEKVLDPLVLRALGAD